MLHKNKKLKYGLLFIAFLFSQTVFSEQDIEKRIDDLLSKMTLREKIGQMNQLNARKPDEKLYNQIRKGEIGSILNAETPEVLTKLQELAVNESPNHIPILFARDVIHGFKTIFPIPLGMAASFNPDIAEMSARVSAVEAAEKGIRWTFAPMMDVSRDPRWGRIAESFGEDTYLSTVLGVAMVKGFQGNDLSDPTSIAACAKHFVGYGASEGGRDYNTTNIPERQLRSVYLPPFESAFKNGCATVMTAFNANDGIPPSGSKFLLKDILRDEWNFDGVVVSDWASVTMMIRQGFCEDEKEAALKAANAGLDMEMESKTFIEHLEKLIEEGKVSSQTIDNAVRNILRLKFRLGLFDAPYIPVKTKSDIYSQIHLKEAQKAAEESFVLLKNEKNILPLSEKIKTVAVIGPMADAPHDQMGTWVFDGEKSATQTPLDALKKMYGNQMNFLYEKGLHFSRDTSKINFNNALKIAERSDAVLLFIGEESILSGEAHSMADLNLVGAQSELLSYLRQAHKPIITVIVAGRPLTIEKEIAQSDALIYAWHPGTMGGPAITNILFGKSNPSGKLPVTFPKHVGQIPVYYSSERVGRPATKKEVLIDKIPLEAKQSSLGNTSYYLDAGFDPLFPFGFGLSYTTFEYKNLRIDNQNLAVNDTLVVSVDIENTGKREGCEIVQLYISDVTASVSTKIKELKSFQRVRLNAGESKNVTLKVPVSELAIWDINIKKIVEAGRFNLMVGRNSEDGLHSEFLVK